MFTGIVEYRTEISDIEEYSGGSRISISVPKPFSSVKRGDSIAVNGCCLTVVRKAGHKLYFDVIHETLRKTNLGKLKKGSAVNLERALKMGDRLNGHYVMGHIDGRGTVDGLRNDAAETKLIIRFPGKLASWIIPKGCICVDGVSLTVGEVSGRTFSLYLIPHTLEETTFGFLKKGDQVNLETDILLKRKVWNRLRLK